MPELRLTTWYYALGIDDALHRMPARVPEQLLLGSEDRAGPPRPEWVREFGGVVLSGVVVGLENRRARVFVGMGSCLLSVTAECPNALRLDEALERDLVRRLARTAGHRAGIAGASVTQLEHFLDAHRINLPVMAATQNPHIGLSTFLYNWQASVNDGRWDLWDVQTGAMIPGADGG